MQSDIFGGRDEPAEDDRLMAVLHELLDELDDGLELRVGCAGELLRGRGEREQTSAFGGGTRFVVLVEGAGGGVEAFRAFVAGVVHDGEAA